MGSSWSCWVGCIERSGRVSAADFSSVGSRSIYVSDVCVEHVSQDVLGVLKSLDHFEVCRLHCTVERIRRPFSLFVDISNDFGLRTKHDFCVVLEVHLHDLV